METFLVRPVRSLGLSHPLAFVLDAVDEYESHAALVKALSSLPSATSLSIRFILLGRSDARNKGVKGSIRLYPLQPVSTATMVCFLTQQLEDVHWEHGRHYVQERMAKLAELANGLFIWARVVCSLLQKRLSRLSPDHILDSILDARRSLGDIEQLATLYHQAIMLLFPDSDAQDLFREYLTATIALQEPLPTDHFSAFTELPTRVIESIQAELKALQIRKTGGDEDERLLVYPARSIFHLSFLEYLESASTPPHVAFHVPLLGSHSQLAECCLRELPRFLPSPHPLSYLGLSPQQRYAVTHVMAHLRHGTPSVQPESADEWKCSRHWAILRYTSLNLLQQWKHLFTGFLGWGPAMEEFIAGEGDGLDTGGHGEIIDVTERGDHRERDVDGQDTGNGVQDGSESVDYADGRVHRDAAAGDGHGHRGYLEEHDHQVACLLRDVASTLGAGYTSRSSVQIDCLEVAIRLRPDDAEFWHLLGWSYLRVAMGSRSVEACEQAITAHRNALHCVDVPTAHDPGMFLDA
jgi:hypothetical protein